MIWTSLRADESYRDFKFIAGKLAAIGFKLDPTSKVDHDYGSVDFKFTALDGKAKLQIVVKPGKSATCQIVEETQVREVTVKKIVCDGIETGEMADAKLTQPSSPAVPAPASQLETKGGDDENPL